EWICPDAPPRPGTEGFADYGGLNAASRWDLPGEKGKRAFSYLFNAAFDARYLRLYLASNGLDSSYVAAFKVESDVQSPSKTPMWGDGYDNEFLFLADMPPPWTIYPDRS